MRSLSTLTIAAGLGAVAALYAGAPERHKAVDPKTLPAPYATKSADNGPKIIPQPDGAALKVPEGFQVSLYAEGLNSARWPAVAPNGDVFCTEGAQNRVITLHDNGDGKPATKTIFASGMNLPFGIAFYKDYLYVANTDSIVRFKYKAGQTAAEGAPEVVVPDLPGHGYRGHWTRDLVFNPQGTKMYVSVGSEVNIGEETDPRRATIMEFNPDGTGGRVYATGIRNAVGKAFNPKTGELWATVNERDGLGDDLVPDYFSSIKDGHYYGWPYYYIGQNHDPRVPEKPELKEKVTVPDVCLTSHVAALGLTFYSGKQFPKEYQGDAFIALHGSANRTKRVGYSIIRVTFKNGKPTGEWEDFLTGWMLDEDDNRVWGRPVGLAVAKDGSLLIVDDGANKIWRVSYKK
jgi:glucose/arabinose dehydrogenase